MNKQEKDGWVIIIFGSFLAYLFIICVVVTFIPRLLDLKLHRYYLLLFPFFFVFGVFLIVLSILIIESYKAARKKPRQSSGISPDENYLVNWDEIEAQVIARDGKKCSKCGSFKNLRIVHSVPRSKGGTNDISNLQILCKSCHKLLHPHMQ